MTITYGNTTHYYSYGSIIAMAVLILSIILFIVFLIRYYADRKKSDKAIQEQWENPVQLPPVTATQATVTDMKCEMVKYGGSTTPRHLLAWTVEFTKETGEKLILIVPQEKYDNMYVGMKGTLATVNGEYFDFE